MPTINLGYKKKRDTTYNTTKHQEVYQDKRWKRLRKLKFLINPLCEVCEKRGKVVVADEIHHIIPFLTGTTEEEIETLAFDYDNLISLCIACHKEAHRLLND
jgi:5-methylcytosine-specific restriction enzyme A